MAVDSGSKQIQLRNGKVKGSVYEHRNGGW